MSNEIPTKVRQDVRERDQGRCIACAAIASDAMHRIPRAAGGHRRSNICLGCRSCHARAHRSPQWGYDMGIMSSRYGTDVADVPILSWRGWVLLDDEGGIEVIAPRSVLAADLAAYQVPRVPPEG